jgi:glycogen operon protein
MRDVEYERRRMSLSELIRAANKQWHGVRLHQPDWSERSHSVAFSVELRKEELLIHLILNAYWEPLEFELPPADDGGGAAWRRWIDTGLDSPDDIVEWQAAPLVQGCTYRAGPRSVVVLYTHLSDARS